MKGLAGRTAIISGGVGALGHAIARALARAGAHIGIGDIRPNEGAQPILNEIRALGRRVKYDQVDVSDAAAVESWVAGVEADLGTPDVIIPNAAIVTERSIRDITPEEW